MPTSRMATVCGQAMHYLEQGSGRPILFLHGNPTSCELWRAVMSRVVGLGRCIAPDLIGMGRSAKPVTGYRFADHAAYLDSFMDVFDLTSVTVVGHDWGVALGADLAVRWPDRIAAFAFMEGRLEPLPDWNSFDRGGRDLFQRLRMPGEGERLVLDETS